MIAPTRKMLWYEPITQIVPVSLSVALRRGQPGARERVVVGVARELVPRIVDRIDLGIVRPSQLAFELEIVGRVGEHHVDRRRGERRHSGHAVALDDAVGESVRLPLSPLVIHSPTPILHWGGIVIHRSPPVKSHVKSKS